MAQQAQLVELLNNKMLNQDELLSTMHQELDKHQDRNTILQRDCHAAKDEVLQLLQALEELATRCDQEQAQAKKHEFDNEQLIDELQLRKDAMAEAKSEYETLQNLLNQEHILMADAKQVLVQDLAELGAIINLQEEKVRRSKLLLIPASGQCCKWLFFEALVTIVHHLFALMPTLMENSIGPWLLSAPDQPNVP
uniref:Uncharacterized protein n=1 Tax=Eptatretus burgeri TaxID=7764 RepID=A0A8C4Q9L9_EPTBU